MTIAEQIAVDRARIRYAKEKRTAFFEGTGNEDEGKWQPGCNFAIKAYRGDTRPKWWCDEDIWVEVNKVKAAIRAALPALLYSNPEYKVWPSATDTEQDAYERAKAKSLWLNHVYRETNGNAHVRNAIQNAFFSLGVIKAGYLCDFEDSPQRGEFARTENGEYILDENGDPTLEQGEFLTDEKGEIIRDADGIPVLHPGTICKEQWFIQAVDAAMMLFDVDSGPDFYQHRFVIEEWVRPLEQVKADPRFPKSKRDKLVSTGNIRSSNTQRKDIFVKSENDSVMESDNVAIEKDEARLRGYDIYDFEKNELRVLPEGGVGDENEEYLLRRTIPAGQEHGPYRVLKFTEDAGLEFYPIPDAIDMARVSQEYNITRSQMAIHREHTKTRFMEIEGAYNGEGINADDERAKWAHGPDGVSIRVSAPNMVLPAPKPQLDNSFMQAVPNIAADFNEVGGMPGESRGVADADTATQASILATGAEMRANDRRDNQVNTFLNEIGRMLLMSGQANAELDTLTMEKIEAATGQIPFKPVKLTPEELTGEFEVEVEIGSTRPKNDPRVIQQILSFMAAFGQTPGIGLIPSVVRRLLDGMGLDAKAADEIFDAAKAILQSQQAPQGSPEAPAGPQGQVLPDALMGQMNAAGGAYTGAPTN